MAPPYIALKARIHLTFFNFITGRAIGDGTVNRGLLRIFMPVTSANPKPKSGVCTADVMIDSTRDLFVRIFVPSQDSKEGNLDKRPVVVYFHGGGFAFGAPNLSAYDDWGRRMCRGTRAVVVSVKYRLSPEHRCPAAYDDGLDVLRFMDTGGLESVDVLANLNVDLGSCFLVGDTAGGNIAHHVARRWAAAAADSWKKVCIKGAMPITPFFGGEERTDADVDNQMLPVLTIERIDWYWKSFLTIGANRDHECAHPFGTKLEERFPPVLVVSAGYDISRDWQLKYHEWLKETSNRDVRLLMYPDAFHGFHLYTATAESSNIIVEMKAFIDELTNP